MSDRKKVTRARFRDSVFGRDKYACRVCGWKQYPDILDAHHVTNRNDMPNGGYVKENGVTLCPDCHIKAEAGSITAEHLYKLIGSSYELAKKASDRLNA
jgi:5-methylcytosine-specific restriction endonuclease McrA